MKIINNLKKSGMKRLLVTGGLFCLATVFLLLAILPSVNAGCCFDTGLGTCSANSDDSSCSSLGGQYYDQVCSSIDLCQQGCCILGSNTLYANAGLCTIRSRTGGFTENFQAGMSRADCDALSKTQEEGACLSGEFPPYNCVFTTRQQCPTNFYPGVSCTSPSLNTTCTTTSKSMCYNQKLYSKDSCGNPDAVLDNCDFASGKICALKTSDSAYCKDLNCEGGKNNGDSWCVDEWGGGGVGVTSIQLEGQGSGYPVGSRFFRQYCLDGQVFTEGCADFREDTCQTGSDGGASCEANPWQECFSANEASSDTSGDSNVPTTTGGYTVDETSCGGDSCQMFLAADNYESEIGPLSSCLKYHDSGYCDGWYSPDEKKTMDENNAKMLEDLGLDMCIPKVKGGIQFYPAQTSSSTDPTSSAQTSGTSSGTGMTTAAEICSQGDFSTTIAFYKPSDGWALRKPSGCDNYGNAGLLNETTDEWITSSCDSDLYATGDNMYNQLVDKVYYNGGTAKIPLNGATMHVLMSRCKAISDCAAEWNWIGQDVAPNSIWGDLEVVDSEKGLFNVYCTRSVSDDGKAVLKCPFDFKCASYKAPEDSSNCHYCGEDGLPCSEYRCKAIGTQCDFKIADGVGYCLANNDFAPPTITLKSIIPPSPVPPYSKVQISITTDKMAECKFNLGSGGNTYTDMKYDFGTGYSTEHITNLYLPGQKTANGDNETGYSLITKDGNYQMYVRCMGVNGKWNLAAKLIEFKVMDTPDTTILDPKNFAPVSGSKIIYNTTQKPVSFTMDEPVECRWSEGDKNFSKMENNFSCDNQANDQTIIHGYNCSGVITNVTLNLSQQSRYYIRCKDQPGLGADSVVINGVTYSRNENDKSYQYVLMPSKELLITDITPAGATLISGKNLTLVLGAITSDGSFDGKARCYWRLSNDTSFVGRAPFTKFKTTDSYSHSHQINPYVGMNYVQVKCEDSAGNLAYENSSFDLTVDTTPPAIVRLYATDNIDRLRIKTIEDAICYISFDKNKKCSFAYNNATIMDGVEKDHTTKWDYDKTYYIKCKDYRGNENTGECAKVIRTY